jgi:hypothetical protein
VTDYCLIDDPREKGLRDAVYASIRAMARGKPAAASTPEST